MCNKNLRKRVDFWAKKRKEKKFKKNEKRC